MDHENPKASVGLAKWRKFACIPQLVVVELGVAMTEGELKYGRHNFRTSRIHASTYIDASMGHIISWWEGEDRDPDSVAQLSHITKAIASLTVLRDAMIQGNMIDDRPPKGNLAEVRRLMQDAIDNLMEEHTDPPEPATEVGSAHKIGFKP